MGTMGLYLGIHRFVRRGFVICQVEEIISREARGGEELLASRLKLGTSSRERPAGESPGRTASEESVAIG